MSNTLHVDYELKSHEEAVRIIGEAMEVARREIPRGAVADYMQIGAATDTALANKVQSYFNLLDFYVKNDVMKEGDINEMAEWLISVADERAAEFDYVMICGPDGKARTDLDKLTEIQERPYFKAIMKEGKDRYVGNPVFGKTTGKAVVHFARAIKRNGKIE